jgi:hypothetical protein
MRRIAALLIVLALAACTAPSTVDGTDGEPPVGPVPTMLSIVDVPLPVQAYLATEEQLDRVALAEVALVRACLARFGFPYDVTPVPSGAYGPASLTDRRYGITDLDLARTDGYGLGPRDPGLATRPAKPDLGPEGEAVLSGQGPSEVRGRPVPEGGCIGEAGRGLTGPRASTADLYRGTELQLTSFAQSRVDSRVKSAFAAWSACMAGAGYRYADPLAAAADPAFIRPLDQHEIDVATTDIGCKASTNLVGVWFTVESAYQQRAIDADPSGFAATRAALAARDELARAAVH